MLSACAVGAVTPYIFKHYIITNITIQSQVFLPNVFTLSSSDFIVTFLRFNINQKTFTSKRELAAWNLGSRTKPMIQCVVRLGQVASEQSPPHTNELLPISDLIGFDK